MKSDNRRECNYLFRNVSDVQIYLLLIYNNPINKFKTYVFSENAH